MDYSRLETKSGMAGNVCLNLQSFEMDITFLTNSEKLVKTRFIDEKSNQQILRVDNEETVKPLLLPISTDGFDAVVISDYNKGYLTYSKINEIVSGSICPVFIDSKKRFLPNKENCFVKIDWERNGDINYIQEKLEYAWKHKEELSKKSRQWFLDNCSFDIWIQKMRNIII